MSTMSTTDAWPAGFAWQDLTLEEVLRAVWVATRGGHTEGQTAGDVRLARPPFVMRRCAPCSSTEAMTAPDLLQHLKTLPWYCDQVAEGVVVCLL